jgi:hypothetical protein
VLQAAAPLEVSGTACAGCTVEIFVADVDSTGYGEGKAFIGASTAAADGSFAVPINGAKTGDSVTATATNPGGNSSEFARNIKVGSGPAPGTIPTISGLNPSSASAGGIGFVLTVTGTNFSASSVVKWNGAERATTFINRNTLTADIRASDLAAPGTAAVTVLNGGSGNESASAPFTITPAVPPPIIRSLMPSAATAGGPGFTLTVVGENFTSNSVVEWDGQNRPTTFVSGTQLKAAIAADDIVDPAMVSITVLDQATKRLSSGVSFPITNAKPPKIQSLDPKSVSAGDAAFTLTITGENFSEDSVVEWNGAERATTFVSSTKIQAAISAADIATAGAVTITVAETVSGTTSNSVPFTIAAAAPGGKRLYLPLIRR